MNEKMSHVSTEIAITSYHSYSCIKMVPTYNTGRFIKYAGRYTHPHFFREIMIFGIFKDKSPIK